MPHPGAQIFWDPARHVQRPDIDTDAAQSFTALFVSELQFSDPNAPLDRSAHSSRDPDFEAKLLCCAVLWIPHAPPSQATAGKEAML